MAQPSVICLLTTLAPLPALRAGRNLPACLAASSPAPAAPDSSKYAILRLGGVRQMLQEGLLYTCPKHCLLQEQSGGASAPPAHQPHQQLQDPASTAGQRSFVLGRVLGLHNGQQFTWGTPYVPNTQVEVEVVEEFQGPKPHSSTAAEPDTSMMTIYRVMHIRAAE